MVEEARRACGPQHGGCKTLETLTNPMPYTPKHTQTQHRHIHSITTCLPAHLRCLPSAALLSCATTSPAPPPPLPPPAPQVTVAATKEAVKAAVPVGRWVLREGARAAMALVSRAAAEAARKQVGRGREGGREVEAKS